MVTATQTESDASLSHHGIKGMRWGVRRFQNKDGSLKNAGKKRYNVDIEDAVTKKQKLKPQHERHLHNIIVHIQRKMLRLLQKQIVS